MKTKQLIEILQKLDPDGKHDVFINNKDIDYIINQPMFFDSYGHLITKRTNCNQPSEISIKFQGQKINIKPIDTFEYFRNKILSEQIFIDIKPDQGNNIFLNSKILYKKLLNLFFCKKYLEKANLVLYPYKIELGLRIDEEILKTKIEFQTSYKSYLENKYDQNNPIYLNLFTKIIECNNNIILNPVRDDKEFSLLEPTNISDFYFEIINNKMINFIQKTKKHILVETNIDLENFNFDYYFGSQWQKVFDDRINRSLFNDQFI